MASGPLARVRRRRQLLGAQGDGAGRGRDSRERPHPEGRGQAPKGGPSDCRRSCRGRPQRDVLGRPPRSRRRAGRFCRPTWRDVHGMATFPRSARARSPARAGLRGLALGRRHAPRLRRRTRRPSQRRAAPHRRDGATGIAQTPAWLGGRQAQRTNDFSPCPVRERYDTPGRRAAGAAGAAGRGAQRAARSRSAATRSMRSSSAEFWSSTASSRGCRRACTASLRRAWMR